MSKTLDPSQPAKEPVQPEPGEHNLTADNDNLTLISLEDLKRVLNRLDEDRSSEVITLRQFLVFLIDDIEEDKARQLEEAQAAMEKFNPVTPIGDV